MAVPPFQRRFRCAHAFSLVAACFAVGTAAVFVFLRIQHLPTPTVPEAEVPAVMDSMCSCSCSEGKDLLCARAGENGTVREIAVLNETGCFLGVNPTLGLMGPTPTARNCSCVEQAFACRATFEYELMNVRWVTRASVAQLVLAVVALIWDVHYLVALYFVVLPSAPEDAINMEWLQHWLKGYWDPLHSAALWIIWGQVVSLGVAPMGVQSPFPRLREFASSSRQLQAGWGPTGIDELVLWCAAFLLAVSALAMMCATPSTAFEDTSGAGGLQRSQQHKVEAQQPACGTIPLLAGVLLMASLGFVIGQPMSFLYALVATVPCWLLQAFSKRHSPWPLERPFPGFWAPWVLPAKELRSQEDALRLVEELEAQQIEKHSSLLDFGGRVQGLCRRVQKLQEAIPWRSPMDLDTRLQAVVLRSLRGAVEMRNACEMRRLLRAAQLLGYCAPLADDDEEESLEAQTQSRKGCCGRLVGYQRLGEGGRKGALFVRDEAWSADVYETLRGGLRQAVESARMLEDDVSLRWLGDMLTVLRPEAMPELCAQIARAAETLTGLIDNADWEHGELFRTVSAAACLQPDAEGPTGITACSWALGLRTPHMRGTMALLLDRLPGNGRTSAADSLKIVEGPSEAAIVEGTRAFAGQAITLAATDLAVGGGRWFFEVQLHGHSSAPSVAEATAGKFGAACRFGWLHEADYNRPEQTNGGAASFKGLAVTTSCTLGAIDAGMNDFEFGYHRTPGCGVVGCALEVSGRRHRAWFALNGVWNNSGAPWDENAADTICNDWSASDRDGPVCPAISGRFVCHLAFQASHFVHGPPDASFRPIAEADGVAGPGHESTLGTMPATIGAAFEPADPDVFEIGDDQC